MNDYKEFIKAYYEFRDSVDFSSRGSLPEIEHLVWYMLVGVPHVPADDSTSSDSLETSIEQRLAILKAVFVEVNNDQPDEFIDRGLNIYDRAASLARNLLKEAESSGLTLNTDLG